MGFFRKSRKRSYDLFSGYGHYCPGIGGMFGLFGLFLVGACLGSLVTILLTVFISDTFAQTYGNVISYPLMFVPPMLYASAASHRREAFEVGYELDTNNFGQYKGWTLALVAGISTFALSFCVEPLTMLLPQMPQVLKDVFDNMLKDSPVWITLISVSVFAPFFEEWLCRGIILRGLLTSQKPLVAITVSAAFFAILHMNPWQAIPAFCLGLWFGYVYYKTGSLKLTMLMHCVNNTFAVIFSQIDKFAEAETFLDVMSPWAYGIAYFVLLILFAGSFLLFSKIEVNKGGAGNCALIPNDFAVYRERDI